MKKLLLWLVPLLVLAGGGYAGYWWHYRPAKADAAAYRTATVKLTNIVQIISATGTVVPEDVIDVGSQINGQIASFGVDLEGKPVDYRSTIKEGQVLALIDDAIYAADVASSEAQLEQSKAQVRVSEASRDQAKARLDQAQLDWGRAQKLGQSRALSQADFDASKSLFEQAQASLALAEASIGQSKASIAIAQASLLRSRRNLTFCTILSPVSGVIIDRRVEIGQTVVASLNAPSLFLIAKDLKRMKVLVQVNEADIGNVIPGRPVAFSVEAFPNDAFKGEVRKVRLNATMTQNVVTYTVEIITDNAELKLLPYLTANVRFEVARRDQVLAVPSAALRWFPPESVVAASPLSASPGTTRTASDTTMPSTSEASTAAPRGKGAGEGRGGGGGEDRQGRSGRPATSKIWVFTDGVLRPVTVKVGLSDGSLIQVESDDLEEGDVVVVGEVSASGQPAAASGASPFAPPNMGGGRRGGR